MPITITIDAIHATDLLSELKALTNALTVAQTGLVSTFKHSDGKQVVAEFESGNVKSPDKDYGRFVKNFAESDDEDPLGLVADETVKPVTPKAPKSKYSAKDQKEIADNMIAEGTVDEEVLAQLSKTQQERVRKAMSAISEQKEAAKAPAPKTNEEFDFGDEEEEDVLDFDDEKPAPKKEEVTIEKLSSLINKFCKDENGIDIPENYKKVHAETQKLIPAGLPVKLKNIPAEKLSGLYDFVLSLSK
jgi:hypothetical protein